MKKILSLSPGDVLIQEGDTSDRIFLVKFGTFNVMVKKDGRTTKVGEVSDGQLVGEMAFIDKKPRSATVVATSRAEVFVVSQESFQKRFDAQPEWFQKFITTMMDRLRQQNKS